MIATTSFAMGIDKSNVRFVINDQLPGKLTDYIQQIGRAGRDHKQAFCITYFHKGDAYRLRNLANWDPKR